jgi:carbon-monoxide dehydrogenase medium subunit
VRSFEYLAPASVGEALDALGRGGGEARVLAGGQSLIPLLSYRLARPRLVVDINRLPLDGIEDVGGALRVGALTRHWQLEARVEIARRCPLLGQAAALIGNARVRSLGTLGGSLAHADPAAELPACLVALEARMILASTGGGRAITAREFFTGALTTAMESRELLVAVEIPAVRGMGQAIEEVCRRAGDFALVAAVALVGLDRRGRVEDARLAFAGVGPVPVRATAAEDALRGQEPTADRLAAAAERARATLRPLSDPFVSSNYRSLLVGVLGRRALAGATARALEVA